MQRKRYNAEFKRETVKLARQTGMVKRQVAQELGIHENLLRTWVRQFAAGKWESAPGKALKSDQQHEQAGRLLGQRGDRELLLDDQTRAPGPQELRHQGRCSCERV